MITIHTSKDTTLTFATTNEAVAWIEQNASNNRYTRYAFTLRYEFKYQAPDFFDMAGEVEIASTSNKVKNIRDIKPVKRLPFDYAGVKHRMELGTLAEIAITDYFKHYYC